MCRIPYDWRGDPELAWAMDRVAPEHSTWVTAIDDPYLPMYYPTLNMWKFLGEGLDKRWIVGQRVPDRRGRGLPARRTGDRPGDRGDRPQGAADRLRRAVAHVLEAAPAARPRGGRAPSTSSPRRPAAADLERIEWFKAGDHAQVLDTMPDVHEVPARGDVRPLPDDGRRPRRGRPAPPPAASTATYENSIGTGQVHLWFDRPEGGFPDRTPRRPTPTTSGRRRGGGVDVPAAGCTDRRLRGPCARPAASCWTATPSTSYATARSWWPATAARWRSPMRSTCRR